MRIRALAAACAMIASVAAAPAVAMPNPPPSNDADTLRDIHGAMPIPPPWWHAWPWAAGTAGGVAALAFGAYAVRRRLRRPDDPATVARRRLARAHAMLDARDVKGFADAVSEALREYLEARFEVRAPRLTTEEFIAAAAEREHSPLAAHRPLLADFLQRADRAKFGGYVLDPDEMHGMEASALRFVDTTARPAPRKEV
jgi:hypothetical protein